MINSRFCQSVLTKAATSTLSRNCGPLISTNQTIHLTLHFALWFDVREPTICFEGRERELSEIEKWCSEWLEPQHSSQSRQFVVLSGLGGIGKGEIAKNFARIFNAKFSDGHCIWINAQTPETQLDSFQRLSLEMKLLISDTESFETLLKEIYKQISQKKCLLILDGIESFEDPILKILCDIKNECNTTTKGFHPFVLITSQCCLVEQHFGQLAQHLKLENLSPDSAFTFIIKSLNIEKRNANLDNKILGLCERLNNFPLALQQAVSFISRDLRDSSPGYEIDCYMKAMEVERKKTLSTPLPPLEAPDSTTVFHSWMATLQKIKERDPLLGAIAADAMTVISFFKDSPIQYDLLEGILKTFPNNNSNVKDFTDAINLLPSYSMCTRNKENGTLSFHKLVLDVFHCHLEIPNSEVNYQQTLEQLLRIISKKEFINSVSSSQLRHLGNVWCHATKYPGSCENLSKLPELLSKRFIHFGWYRELYTFTDELYTIANQNLGEDHRATLWMAYWKSCALEKLGKYTESRELLLNIYSKQKSKFDESDDHTLRSAQVIGSTFWYEKQYREAMKWFETILPWRNHYPKRKQTLVLKNNMALALMELTENEKERAFEIFNEILEIKRDKYGEDHLETLIARHNIGFCHFSSERYKEALEVLETVLKDKKKLLLDRHPEVLNTEHLLSRTLAKMKNYKEAFDKATKTLEARREVLGDEHPHTVNSFNLVEELRTIMASM